jgi:hypothetical protein
VKLCTANPFLYTVDEIDRSSMNFTETSCCRVKSSVVLDGGIQLEAFPGVEVEELKPPVVVP